MKMVLDNEVKIENSLFKKQSELRELGESANNVYINI